MALIRACKDISLCIETMKHWALSLNWNQQSVCTGICCLKKSTHVYNTCTCICTCNCRQKSEKLAYMMKLVLPSPTCPSPLFPSCFWHFSQGCSATDYSIHAIQYNVHGRVHMDMCELKPSQINNMLPVPARRDFGGSTNLFIFFNYKPLYTFGTEKQLKFTDLQITCRVYRK